MAVVISNLLVVVLLTLALCSSTEQQNFLPGNKTELILSLTNQIISKTLFSPELFKHQIKDKKSYKSSKKAPKKKEPNKFVELTEKMKKWLKTKDEKIVVEHLITIPGTPTPFVDKPFPSKVTFPDDGCDSRSVRFNDGKCYPLMGRQPCEDLTNFVTIDPVTHKGRCNPRLCGRDRVFVARTGLCHDIYDKTECEGGRRLYYSPYGETVCDCPIGQYPFPKSHDDCVPLFTQGPCPIGQVVAISPDGYHLRCMESKCPTVYKRDKYSLNPLKQKQLVPVSDGRCHELGSDDGPCSNNANTSFLGLNILKNELSCVDIKDPSSSYFVDKEENDLLDNIYSEFSPEYSLFHIYTAYQSLLHVKTDDDDKKKKKVPKGTYQRKRRQLPDGTKNVETVTERSDRNSAAITEPTVPLPVPCHPRDGGKCIPIILNIDQNRPRYEATNRLPKCKRRNKRTGVCLDRPPPYN